MSPQDADQRERALRELARAAARRDVLRSRLDRARAEVADAIEAADRAGAPRAQIARAARIARSRLYAVLGQ